MSGICTFEDVIEALLNKTISDEFDMQGVRLDLKRAGIVMKRVARLKKLAAMSKANISFARVSDASGSPLARSRGASSFGRDDTASESGALRSGEPGGYGSVAHTDSEPLLAGGAEE
jgi:hypothetical protein